MQESEREALRWNEMLTRVLFTTAKIMGRSKAETVTFIQGFTAKKIAEGTDPTFAHLAEAHLLAVLDAVYDAQ